MKPTLHLLMGLPGSGKTTLGKVLESLTGAVYLSSDESRLALFKKPCFSQEEHDMLYATLDHNVEHLLRAGYDVIYDANLNRRHHRQEKYDLAEKFGANAKLWFVEVNPEVARKRRIAEQGPRLVPQGESSARMFDRVANLIEMPENTEAAIKVDGINITEDTIKTHLATRTI
jgi:predicted kinase